MKVTFSVVLYINVGFLFSFGTTLQKLKNSDENNFCFVLLKTHLRIVSNLILSK